MTRGKTSLVTVRNHQNGPYCRFMGDIWWPLIGWKNVGTGVLESLVGTGRLKSWGGIGASKNDVPVGMMRLVYAKRVFCNNATQNDTCINILLLSLDCEDYNFQRCNQKN